MSSNQHCLETSSYDILCVAWSYPALQKPTDPHPHPPRNSNGSLDKPVQSPSPEHWKKSFGNVDLTIDSPGHSFTLKGWSVHPCPQFPASRSNLYAVPIAFRHCAGP